MNKKLESIHGKEKSDLLLNRIQETLLELYGKDLGEKNFMTLSESMTQYLESLSPEELSRASAFSTDQAYASLQGKVFAICYPDNVYQGATPCLQTLQEVLNTYFPSVNGIHILPERQMSHGDIWPQDLLPELSSDQAIGIVDFLIDKNILETNKYLSKDFEDLWPDFQDKVLRDWCRNQNVSDQGLKKIVQTVDGAFNSHFNDGGFSQITRDRVDPRFGTTEDIQALSKQFAIMLDFVVNHVDIDNPSLEAYRRGTDSGEAFLIISPHVYEKALESGEIAKTFRPRPFPLFTGMRKFSGKLKPVETLNELYESNGLQPLDKRLCMFQSIYFQVKNDQGLTAQGKRIFRDFENWMSERGLSEEDYFIPSEIQANQKIFKPEYSKGLDVFLKALGYEAYYPLFAQEEESIFGEKFFIYTTFSESQADVYPKTREGFTMVIEDLFTLLLSGDLAMMRMDAIKYLWKELGGKNFDVREGNLLIQLVRDVMTLAAPQVLPLDEINSPDPTVYRMGQGGGFSYLFGQVNTTVIALNSQSCSPLSIFYSNWKELCPKNLVLFVMLSTHDGRSAQGLGVQHLNGNASIEEFFSLMKIVDENQGKPKFRSVTKGQIPLETLTKICSEARLPLKNVLNFFEAKESNLFLKNSNISESEFIEELAESVQKSSSEIEIIPAIQYLTQWIIYGKTPYELCATSRSALSQKGMSPQQEANRLALAQAYIFSLGQVVPAIYFNDLLGLANDVESYKFTGRPRDLNRHKSSLQEIQESIEKDEFTRIYIGLVNKLLEIRTQDKAFYPGSPAFEFKEITPQVFVNHAYYQENHTFMIGNVSGKKQTVKLNLSGMQSWEQGKRLVDKMTAKVYKVSGNKLTTKLPPYGFVWLKED